MIFLLGPIDDFDRFAKQGIFTIFLVGNIGAYLFSGDYFSPNPNPYVHSWSLSVEEQIYLVLPIILMLFLHNRNSIKKVSTFVLILITVTSFIAFQFPTILKSLYSIAGIQYVSQFSFYSPVERIWQFTLGSLGSILLDQNRSKFRVKSGNVKIVLVSAVFFILFAPITLNLKVSVGLASLFAVTTILTHSFEVIPRTISRKLKWLGDRSYSIYLFHFPLIYLAKYSPLTKFGSSENRLIQSVIAVIITVSLGSVSYHRIENRFRNRGNSESHSSKFIVFSFVKFIILPVVLLVALNHLNEFGVKARTNLTSNTVLPWKWDKECQFYSSPTNISLEPCNYGMHDSGGSILLIGDSHAASDSRAIIKLGNTYNLDTYVFTYEGCGFVLSKKDFQSSYSYPYLTADCLKHNQLIIDFIMKKKPTFVIWAHRSSSIMVLPNNYESRLSYNQMVAKSLSLLMKLNVITIHIGSEPEMFPITTRLEGMLTSKVDFSKIPFEDNSFWENEKVTDYYLNTIQIFCPNNICSGESARDLFFQDTDHLSEIGADMLLPGLEFLMEEALRKIPSGM